LNAAELDRRAWIGPINANLLAGLVKDQGIKIDVTYINTGREPWTNFIALAKSIVLSQAAWNNGGAKQFILDYRVARFNVHAIQGTRAAFLTSEKSSYVAHADNISDDIPESLRFKASNDLVSGKDFFAIFECFVYHSVSKEHYISVCCSYQAEITDRTHLNIYTVGTDAD